MINPYCNYRCKYYIKGFFIFVKPVSDLRHPLVVLQNYRKGQGHPRFCPFLYPKRANHPIFNPQNAQNQHHHPKNTVYRIYQVDQISHQFTTLLLPKEKPLNPGTARLKATFAQYHLFLN